MSKIQDTSMPLATPSDVLSRYLSAWAYHLTSASAYVAPGNVTFIKQKMKECGHPDFPVYPGCNVQGRMYGKNLKPFNISGKAWGAT
jgi:hypothetical protein